MKAKPTKKKVSKNLRPGSYTEEQKRMVLERYPYCNTRQEKLELMRDVGMDTLDQLYNLANRLKVAGRRYVLLDEEERATHPAFDASRRLLREEPDTSAWSEEDDTYIKDWFGRRNIEEIALYRGHTETAILYRARKLGVRHYVKYWPLEHVLDWIGLSEEEAIDLGLDVYDCKDYYGEVQMRLASTSSLLRIISDPTQRKILLGANIDLYFLQELEDLLEDHQYDQVRWEPSRWVSHGHICLNPWAGDVFGLFDQGTDYKMRAREALPGDLVHIPKSIPRTFSYDDD